MLLWTQMRLLGANLLWTFSLLACAVIPAVSVHAADGWREEVLLHDGHKIIVERSQTYGGRSEPGQSGPIAEHTIHFTLPGSGKSVTWTSPYDSDIGRTSFFLLAVHVKDQIPYVVTEPNLCLSYNKWGRPNPPYVIFKLEGNTWQRIGMEQLPSEFTTFNVMLSIQDFDAKNWARMGLIPVEMIKERNAAGAHPDFSREPLANGGESCRLEFTNGKGRWLSADWFSEQKSIQSCVAFCKHEDFSEAICPCKQFFKGE